MITIRISERPQAWVKPSGFASSDSWKIFTGTVGNGSKGLKWNWSPWARPVRKRTGAVSPAARATERSVAVTMPPVAAGG